MCRLKVRERELEKETEKGRRGEERRELSVFSLLKVNTHRTRSENNKKCACRVFKGSKPKRYKM